MARHQKKLGRYRDKRAAGITNEPFGDEAPDSARDGGDGTQTEAGAFVIHLHDATRRHYDVRLEVGGVLVNDVPTYRIDHMPYGGVKDSGLGREGPRYTIEEMSELRLLIVAR